MKVIGKNKEKVAEGREFEPTGEILEKGFNAEWGGHTFSEDEIESLLAGEEISITTKNNNVVSGKLAKDSYKGHEFWGFVPEKKSEKEKVAVGRRFKPTGEILEKGFNAEWGGHTFSEDEIESLLAGEEIIVLTASGKPVVGILAQSTFKGSKFWGFQCGIPNMLAGHEFTAVEKEKMYNGESVYIEDFWSKRNATYYAAWVSWDPLELDVVLDFDDREPNNEAEYCDDMTEIEEEDTDDEVGDEEITEEDDD